MTRIFWGIDDADYLLGYLASQICWRVERISPVRPGARGSPADCVGGTKGRCYRYSGLSHVASGWPVELEALRHAVGERLGASPDFALLNRYRDGQNTIGWHRDDESMSHPWIASVSLGATRTFLMRDRNGTRSSVELEHGSLLLMDRRVVHCLPRRRVCGPNDTT